MAGEVESADIDLFWRRAEAQSTTGDTVQVREAVVRYGGGRNRSIEYVHLAAEPLNHGFAECR